MAAEEVKGMERMLGGRKRQKREVKETRVDRWLSLPPISVSALLLPQALRQANESINVSVYPAMSRVARFHTNSTDRNRFCNCSPLLNHFSSDCPHSWHVTERGISVSCYLKRKMFSMLTMALIDHC